MSFNFNKAVHEDSKNAPQGSRSSDYQKIFNDDAPSMGYISSKAPCEFILVPPHPMYNSSTAMTSGGFRQDPLRGVVPTLGQYGIDWVMVYRKIGNDPDQRKRKDVLAINMIEGEDGMIVQTEREWGKGYTSPMYKLREYLWRLGGAHKYNKNTRRSEPTLSVDTTTAKYRRAHELVPVDNNDLNSPLGKAARTMFLQGFVVNNAGISYTVDEDNQPCWPKHKILMINQVSAIKSRDDARTKEGFYDAWFERIDGVPMDPETVYGRFGDIGDSESAQLAWEAGFKHSDFGVNQKLVTFSSYPSGPAGIATYCCSVQNLSDKFGPSYALPDDVLQKAKPFSEYILLNNEKLQIQWLLELFQGDEWAMVEAGIIPDGSNKVSMYTAPEVTSPMPAPIAPVPTPMAAPAPRVPAAPAMSQAPRAPQAPQIPVATPQAPSSGFSTGNVGDLSVNLKNLMNTLKNKSAQA